VHAPRRSPALASAILRHYQRRANDPLEPRWAAFYQTFRACVRAKLALWHLDDDVVDDAPKWQRRAGEYLTLARRYAAELG
jgi:aminoglycoside phosphotransferase family enzyme